MIALAAPCVSTSSPNYATRCANAAQRALTSACWAASTQFEKRSTTSGRGDSQRSALALGRVLQACSEVVARQLLELFEQLIPRRATGQIPEDIPDLDASSRDAGLPLTPESMPMRSRRLISARVKQQRFQAAELIGRSTQLTGPSGDARSILRPVDTCGPTAVAGHEPTLGLGRVVYRVFIGRTVWATRVGTSVSCSALRRCVIDAPFDVADRRGHGHKTRKGTTTEIRNVTQGQKQALRRYVCCSQLVQVPWCLSHHGADAPMAHGRSHPESGSPRRSRHPTPCRCRRSTS
jgi:hypothetical protein